MMLHPDADSFVIMAVYHSFCATATIVKHLHTEFISETRLFWFICSPYVKKKLLVICASALMAKIIFI